MSEHPRKILIFLPNWVGDVVMATPVLRAVRKGFPDARIVYLGRAVSLAVMHGSAWADEYIEDTSRVKPKLKCLFATVQRIKKISPDATLLLPNSFRSALMCKLAGAKKIIGYARGGRGFLLDEKIAPLTRSAGVTKYQPVPMIDYYARLLDTLGLSCDDLNMELPISHDGEAAAKELLLQADYDSNRPLVMMNPGASFGTSKLWLAERFGELADLLNEKFGAQIIINASPAESERAIAAKAVSAMKKPPLLDMSKQKNTIAVLKSLASRCKLMITNDTGTRHIAAAFGCGVVTIFGSTDPEWARIDYPRERIVRVDVDCGPCQKKFCPLPQGEGFHRCITGVTTDMVFDACCELIQQETE